jgi:hypothetical protein
MQAAIVKSARPATVRSRWRSDAKITAGRHLMYVAGTSAKAKHAIAPTSPKTIKNDVRPIDPPELLRAGVGWGSETRTALRGAGFGSSVLRGAGTFFVLWAGLRAFGLTRTWSLFGAAASGLGRT